MQGTEPRRRRLMICFLSFQEGRQRLAAGGQPAMVEQGVTQAPLPHLGPQAREALPALLQALQDREPLVQDAAADAIGCIGPDAPDAMLALMQALTDTNSFVQATAAKALKKVDGPYARRS